MVHTKDICDKYSVGVKMAIQCLMPFYDSIEGTKCLIYAVVASIETRKTDEQREELLKFLVEAREYVKEELYKRRNKKKSTMN